jgi:hypothetical protein
MHKKHAYTNHQNGFKNTPNGIKIDQSDSNPQKCLFTSLWLSSKTRFGSLCLDKLPPTQHLAVLFLQMFRWFNWSERTLKEIRQTETHQKKRSVKLQVAYHWIDSVCWIIRFSQFHNPIFPNLHSFPIVPLGSDRVAIVAGAASVQGLFQEGTLGILAEKLEDWFFFPEIRGMWTWKCLFVSCEVLKEQIRLQPLDSQ